MEVCPTHACFSNVHTGYCMILPIQLTGVDDGASAAANEESEEEKLRKLCGLLFEYRVRLPDYTETETKNPQPQETAEDNNDN